MMKRRYVFFRNVLFAISILLLVSPPIVRAEDPTDTKPDYDFYSSNDVIFYDPTATGVVCSTGGGTITTGGSTSKYSLEQVKAFAAESITSTWNISDGTVEQWFLKQASVRGVITKFGLTSSNISGVTSAVRAAGVSPVLFYLYAVNEGGGAGGFINNGGGDVPGGAVPNATHDAGIITSRANSTDYPPATGGGEPADMPTAEAKALLDALPKGSIGKMYIVLTSAVTAEIEDLSGKTGSWSNLFGKPLSSAMQNIQNMGGNPMDGGASIASDSCPNGVTGEGMARGISWAKMIANNNGYGYDQPTRETGWEKWQSDPNCTNQCGSFDCSSFVSAILTVGGYFKTNPNFSTADEESVLAQAGFKKVSLSNLQPGDILHRDGHTEMYIGNGQDVSADHNENGGISGGKVGDQTGKEIVIRPPFSGDHWDSAWRAPN